MFLTENDKHDENEVMNQYFVLLQVLFLYHIQKPIHLLIIFYFLFLPHSHPIVAI